MKILLSPAKRLNELSKTRKFNYTTPELLNKSKELINYLKLLTPDDISKLMNISKKLGELNYNRFQAWETPFNINNSKAAIFLFEGDAYKGLNAKTLLKPEIIKLNKTLRIISGLYGLLKPLDLIQSYRLEMKTKLQTANAKNLYDFWGDTITNQLNKEIERDNVRYVINLASNEYFKAINTKKLNAKIINPIFKESKNGTFKIVAINAKRARGLMTRFIVKYNIKKVNDLKAFDYEGYFFNAQISDANNFIFTR